MDGGPVLDGPSRPTARHSRVCFWKPPRIPSVPISRSVSMETARNIFSIITFQWITPILMTGYRRPLELNDIWLVNPKGLSERLAEILASSFRKALDDGEKQPLRRALYETLKFDFVLGGVCQLIAALPKSSIHLCCDILSPSQLKHTVLTGMKFQHLMRVMEWASSLR